MANQPKPTFLSLRLEFLGQRKRWMRHAKKSRHRNLSRLARHLLDAYCDRIERLERKKAEREG